MYSPPDGNAIVFATPPDAYAAPAGDEIDFNEGSAGSPTGVGAVTLVLSAAASGTHSAGFTGVGAVDLGVVAGAVGAHGVQGAATATLAMSAASVAVHERYHLKGEVRDATGTLVNRRVRVYNVDDGELVAQQDTTSGRFDIQAPVGMYYLIPINVNVGAADWSPPVANRVEAALVVD